MIVCMIIYYSVARRRACNLLNYRKPEHPPDIYFIRRKPHMLDKYLDKQEMHSIINDAPNKYRLNYELFQLDPQEKII